MGSSKNVGAWGNGKHQIRHKCMKQHHSYREMEFWTARPKLAQPQRRRQALCCSTVLCWAPLQDAGTASAFHFREPRATSGINLDSPRRKHTVREQNYLKHSG